MSVKSILDQKGRDVATVDPDVSLGVAARLLAEKKIGALVVTKGNSKIAGILSERDIVRLIGSKGVDALALKVSDAMTASVKICREDHSINDVMEIMTMGRFRHLPVEKDGALDGIISIGDVVKRRIEDVEREAEEIRTYIATA